jgi:hypothetical protein
MAEILPPHSQKASGMSQAGPTHQIQAMIFQPQQGAKRAQNPD